MTKPAARVYSIAPGGRFLQILADEILGGFPFGESQRDQGHLFNWSIFLPTRRSTRVLGSLLFEKSQKKAILLPNIKPIGDIDDEQIKFEKADLEIKSAISKTGQVFLLLDILKNWAAQNPQISIAAEIQASSAQSLSLANSLVKLVDQIETEETSFSHLTEAYESDLSDHRNSILSLLGLLNVELPQRIAAENLIGSSARRSLMIRLEAARIANAKAIGPIIAAGSTGTIPATRALLKAIAYHEQGAVILPGLDLDMADEDWACIGPDHPQFSLKTLIADLEINRDEVVSLGVQNQARNDLSAELMRPSVTAEKWHHILKTKTIDFKQAATSIRLITAPDRHLEARAIALIMREALEVPTHTVALITPDRDLAGRVKSELLRWNISVNDSAGEPLVHHGIAALAALILQAVKSEFAAADLLAVLAHPDCTCGFDNERFLTLRRNLEIVVLRGYTPENGLKSLQQSYTRAYEAKLRKARQHYLVSTLQDDDWAELSSLITHISEALAPVIDETVIDPKNFIGILTTAIQYLAPDADWTTPENQNFIEVCEELQSESHRLAHDKFSSHVPCFLMLLQTQKYRSTTQAHPRLAIYGVLEARLMPADIVILGGLNEGRWPAQPDPGPWLNRPMRKIFGMQQPERDIGVSAHDFTQALGYNKVYLTCAQRLEGSPQTPSRWILRLQTVLKGAGVDANICEDASWVKLAKNLDAAETIVPRSMPKPQPNIEHRPTHFSVTEVEKLIRDPYAIYAKKILRLEPLPNLSRDPDAALRGTLFHEAIGEWNKAQPEKLSDHSLGEILQAGEQTFSAFRSDAEISNFWKPRFVRLAKWLVGQEVYLRKNILRVSAELDGKMEFVTDGQSYSLSARADRIDILNDGSARILDYKSGTPPTVKEVLSGISPQLLLEVAILSAGNFQHLQKAKTSELLYIQISGGSPPGKIIQIIPIPGQSITDVAEQQLSNFKNLLRRFRNPAHPYVPRLAIKYEDDKTDFDHLSRHLEWLLADGNE